MTRHAASVITLLLHHNETKTRMMYICQLKAVMCVCILSH